MQTTKGDSSALSSMFKQRRQPLALNGNLDRLPPHSEEAEQGVLGCLLLSPNDLMAEFLGTGGLVEWFYDLRHQEIIKAMLKLFECKKPIDLITIHQTLKGAKKEDECGGIAYISQLPDGVPSAANFSYYLEIVHEKYLLRKVIQTSTDAIGRAYGHEGEVALFLNEYEKEVLSIGKDVGETFVNIQSTLEEVKGRVQRVVDTGKSIGLSTGFRDFDSLTGGLEAGWLVILAGERSVGKTSLAMNILEHRIFQHNEHVGIISLETGAVSLISRMVCCRQRINSRNLRTGLDIYEKELFDKGVAIYEKHAHKILLCEDSGLTGMKIRAKGRRMVQQGAKILLVDFLQLIQSDSKKIEATERVGRAAYEMKDMARELGVPVIVISALSRAGDLKNSGDIDYGADTIIKLRKDKDSKKTDDKWRIHADVDKGKDCGEGKFELDFWRPYFLYQSVSKVEDSDCPE